ncbi:hypothetical protein B0H13DRAFT_1049321 [Mycena leptocephala]|nr:hypothetical protein B0H13DRAFT_1049321 [Mycena leptocephala]
MTNLSTMPETVWTLPLELERHIFELVALSCPASIPNLMRIAWRITTWVEPLLYRTLVMMPRTTVPYEIPLCSFDKFARIARSKPPSFLDAVRNVMVLALHSQDMCSEDMNIVIRTCPRIENLYIFGSWNLHSCPSSSPWTRHPPAATPLLQPQPRI